METKKQIVDRYSDGQQALIRKLVNDEQLFTLIFKDLVDGISRVGENPIDTNGWMNDLVKEHIAIPRQKGDTPNHDEFLRKSEAIYEAQRMIKEVMASWQIVNDHDDTPKEPTSRPSGR